MINLHAQDLHPTIPAIEASILHHMPHLNLFVAYGGSLQYNIQKSILIISDKDFSTQTIDTGNSSDVCGFVSGTFDNFLFVFGGYNGNFCTNEMVSPPSMDRWIKPCSFTDSLPSLPLSDDL
eukprot:TRINITY_DN28386_c0_g1_i1.p1 TRINITY_DN28386_c0_g1~~TRINITY_DN28386_c0_g1_i1.p1  ORF type:complete len:122 (-),score=25.96 TRINITY_DN28386_c0_g1_i1:236-601(-)